MSFKDPESCNFFPEKEYATKKLKLVPGVITSLIGTGFSQTIGWAA